jgi:hypothetical protein
MNGTLIILAIGVLLLGILFALFLFQGKSITRTAAEPDEPRVTQALLIALELDLPSRTLAEQIFDPQDWHFVKREVPSLQKQLLQERKALAFLWLDETRSRIARLHFLHRMAVRKSRTLNIVAEIKIIAIYFEFQFMAATALGLVYLFGPFHVRGAIARMSGVADRVARAAGQVLAVLEPSLLAKIKDDWGRRSNLAV